MLGAITLAIALAASPAQQSEAEEDIVTGVSLVIGGVSLGVFAGGIGLGGVTVLATAVGLAVFVSPVLAASALAAIPFFALAAATGAGAFGLFTWGRSLMESGGEALKRAKARKPFPDRARKRERDRLRRKAKLREGWKTEAPQQEPEEEERRVIQP